MTPRGEKNRTLTSLMTIALIAAAKAACQENQNQAMESAPAQRRIVVSIPDRKLALIEKGQVVKIYDTAVGGPVQPRPELTRSRNGSRILPGTVRRARWLGREKRIRWGPDGWG